MKFLLICRGDPFTTPAGTEIFVGNLSVTLANQGHEVYLISEVRSNVGYMYSKSENLKMHGLQLIGIPYIRALDFRRKCSNYCAKLMSEFDVDAIIAFGAGTFAGYIFDRIKMPSRPLLIYYAMDSMIMEYERSKASIEAKGMLTSFKRWIWYISLIKSDKASCLNSDLILASSKDAANHLITDYDNLPTKIKVLYAGVPDDFADGIDIIDPNVPTFFHIAGGSRKGTDFFLKAMKLLKDKYALRAKAVIVRASSFHVKQAEALRVETKAYEYLSNVELKPLYASCTALISSSLSEGFCLPVIEAAMFGKPAIVSNVGSLPELVVDRENGFVVPAASAEALAEKMYLLGSDGELRRKMGEEAKKVSKKFRISKAAEKLVDIFR
jgi:glycosyltransferase involved in cell wall biosynthesis